MKSAAAVKSPAGGDESPRRYPLWSPASYRLRVAVSLALALSIEGVMRSNINMAMICMVNETAIEPPPEANAEQSTGGSVTFAEQLAALWGRRSKDDDVCANFSAAVKREKKVYGGDLVITQPEQSAIFTAFYLGGLAFVMPGGYLNDRYGTANVLFWGAVVNVVGSLTTPVVARHWGARALTALRFLMGCGQGVLIPSMHVLVANWFPLGEKSTAIAIATTGNQVSVIVAMFSTAKLCQFQLIGGWASAFYLCGLAGLALLVLWRMWVWDTPASAEGMSGAELKYIQADETTQVGHAKDPVPWRRILTSAVVWSASMSSFSQNFMIVGIVAYLPTYYRNVLGMDIEANGLMSPLPFVVQLITKVIFTGAADSMKRRAILSHSAVVKLFNLIASVGSGVCLLLLAFCDCSHARLAISLTIIAMALGSGFIPGYNISVVCVAPRYASAIASFSRLLGQIASVAAPYMIGAIVVKGARDEWQLAFLVMAFVLISTGILFQCCGSATVQEWARMPRGATAPPPPLLAASADGSDVAAFVGPWLDKGAEAPKRAEIVKLVVAPPNGGDGAAAALLEPENASNSS